MKTNGLNEEKKSSFSSIMTALMVITLVFGLILLVFAIVLVSYKNPIIIEGEILNKLDDGRFIYEMGLFEKIGIILLICLFFVCFPLAQILGRIMGNAKANKKIEKDFAYIKKISPYIYYRELPNNYGIGVCTLLTDSTIENEKDIVAAILDLCAKKYLKLEKVNDGYIISILKKVDDFNYLTTDDIKNGLLLNEKYIIQCIMKNSVKNIDYNKWYSLCLRDGKNHGLFYNQIMEKMKPISNYKLWNRLVLIIAIIVGFCFIISMIPLIKENINEYEIFAIIYLFIAMPIFLLGVYILSTIIALPIFMLITAFKTYVSSEGYYYNHKIGKNLVITEKGKEELQKIYAFEDFIKDFSTFADKNIEEIVLWDRYLSYAQVFGLTKEIMRTGYNQLIKNSSFKIDNIDNIKINNINVEQQT